MKKIKAILFDKDGTLIQFQPLWRNIIEGIINDLDSFFQKNISKHLRKELLQSVGVYDEYIKSDGILSAGTTKDLSNAFTSVLKKHGIEAPEHFINWLEKQITLFTKENMEVIQPVTDLKKLLNKLKQRGFKIGIATSDDYESTILSLQVLGIEPFFDFVGTSDRFPSKPKPFLLQAFCKQSGINADEVVVVGDTTTDMLFARNGNAAFAVGVKTGTGTYSELKDMADLVITSVEDLFTENGELIWDKN